VSYAGHLPPPPRPAAHEATVAATMAKINNFAIDFFIVPCLFAIQKYQK
jgi:hypothetical protein